MALVTEGFRTNVLPTYTPVDPRYAIRDPFAFSAGLNRGLADMQALEQDALLRQDRPRQQILRDIELAKAQAEMASMPRQNRLRDLQLADAERKFRIGALTPIEFGKPVREFDAEGNIIEYQPTLDIDPATGLPYGPGEKPAMDTSIVKTRQQIESEQRAMEALAQQRAASGEAALIRATAPSKNTVKRAYDYENNRQVDEVRDAQGNVVEIRVVVDEQGREVPPPPRSQGAGGLTLESMVGGATTPPPAQQPATITGTQAPANQVPDIQLAIPFNSEAEAVQAAQEGRIQPGQRILINGRPAIWE